MWTELTDTIQPNFKKPKVKCQEIIIVQKVYFLYIT